MLLLCALQDPRLLSYALRLRYSDFDKVDKITSDINAFFESHSGVDHKLPYKAALTDLATYSVDISITVSNHTESRQFCKSVTSSSIQHNCPYYGKEVKLCLPLDYVL